MPNNDTSFALAIAALNGGGGGGGTTNYNELENKPKINDVELTGNKSLEDLGIEQPDVDKAYVDAQLALKADESELAGKQDVLTAGDNITIEDNVISAVVPEVEYTAGTGIDISNDVISVTDPIPEHTASDSGKVLKVDTDGSIGWETSGGSVAIDNKTIVTDETTGEIKVADGGSGWTEVESVNGAVLNGTSSDWDTVYQQSVMNSIFDALNASGKTSFEVQLIGYGVDLNRFVKFVWEPSIWTSDVIGQGNDLHCYTDDTNYESAELYVNKYNRNIHIYGANAFVPVPGSKIIVILPEFDSAYEHIDLEINHKISDKYISEFKRYMDKTGFNSGHIKWYDGDEYHTEGYGINIYSSDYLVDVGNNQDGDIDLKINYDTETLKNVSGKLETTFDAKVDKSILIEEFPHISEPYPYNVEVKIENPSDSFKSIFDARPYTGFRWRDYYFYFGPDDNQYSQYSDSSSQILTAIYADYMDYFVDFVYVRVKKRVYNDVSIPDEYYYVIYTSDLYGIKSLNWDGVEGKKIPCSAEFIPIDNTTITINSDGKLEAQGGGSSYTAGDGIDISSNVISADSTIARVDDIPTVPTNVSAFTNDAGYLTSHQDISGLATKAELEAVEDEIPDITGLATETYVDTQVATKSAVSGTNDGTNWTSLTVDGVTKDIPAGGGGSSYTFTNGLTESGGTVSWDYNDNFYHIPATGIIPVESSKIGTVNGNIVSSVAGYDNSNRPNLNNNSNCIVFTRSFERSPGNSLLVGSSGQIIHADLPNQSVENYGLYSTYIGRFANDWRGNFGNYTVAIGDGVCARGANQTVLGTFNDVDTSSLSGQFQKGKYSFVIGNGEDESTRSNALTVDWNGNLTCNNIPAQPTSDGVYTLQCSIVDGVATYTWVQQQTASGNSF